MTTHVRVCRECGEEYRPEVAVCADCGGELEDRRLDDDGVAAPAMVAPQAPPVEAPPPRVVFVASHIAEVVPLAETLREAEIAHRLGELPPVADGAPVRYALLVAEEDATEALRAIGPALLSEGHDADAEAVETRFAAGRGAYVECPACGARQPEGAVECPECGLGLGSGAATCAKCGEPLAEPDADCAACGAPAPR